MKVEFPLAHVATVPVPTGSVLQGWNPLDKLAQFKELQARYAQASHMAWKGFLAR